MTKGAGHSVSGIPGNVKLLQISPEQSSGLMKAWSLIMVSSIEKIHIIVHEKMNIYTLQRDTNTVSALICGLQYLVHELLFLLFNMKHRLPNIIEIRLRIILRKLWMIYRLQQDGAPVHNSREVRAFLSLGRRGRLI